MFVGQRCFEIAFVRSSSDTGIGAQIVKAVRDCPGQLRAWCAGVLASNPADAPSRIDTSGLDHVLRHESLCGICSHLPSERGVGRAVCGPNPMCKRSVVIDSKPSIQANENMYTATPFFACSNCMFSDSDDYLKLTGSEQ